MTSRVLVWFVLLLAGVATQDDVETTDAGVTEELPKLPNGCLSPESHPDCFSAGDVTASVVGTFVLTLAIVLLFFAIHRLCWRVYNTKLANYAI